MTHYLLLLTLFIGFMLGAEEVTPDNISKLHQEAALVNNEQTPEVVEANSQEAVQPITENAQDVEEVESETNNVMTGKTLRRLNIRVRPSFEHEVVGILERDVEVEIVSAQIKDWYEIRLPAKSQVWIYKGDVGPDGKIIVNKCIMRSGSGVIFNPYKQTLQKDEAVTILNEENNWVQITPPEGRLTAWVSAQYVKLDNPELLTPPQEAEENKHVATDDKPQEEVAVQPETTPEAEPAEEAENEQPQQETEQVSEAESTEKMPIEEPAQEPETIGQDEPVTPPQVEEPIQPIVEKNPYAFTPTDLPIKSIQGNTGRHVWCGYIYRMSRTQNGATHQLVVHLDNGKKARVGYLCSDHAHIFLNDWQGWPVIVYGRLTTNKGINLLHVSGLQIDYRKLK